MFKAIDIHDEGYVTFDEVKKSLKEDGFNINSFADLNTKLTINGIFY